MRNEANLLQSCSKLQSAESQCCCNTENRTAKCSYINNTAESTIQTILKQWIKTTSYGQRQMIAETKIRQCQSKYTIDCPSVYPPMEKCIEHGSFSTSPLRQVRIKRKGIVRNWFGYAKVHKSDSHSGSEEHCNPG